MQTSNSLLPSEWLIVSLFSLLLLTLGSLSFYQQSFLKKPLIETKHDSFVLIKVEGAVLKPGIFQVPAGSSLQDVIALAAPKNEADLRFIKKGQQAWINETVIIPSRQWITIYLKGAVEEEGTFQVLSGTRYEELLDLLTFESNADLKSLRKKKVLRPEETIEIPKKQVKIRKVK